MVTREHIGDRLVSVRAQIPHFGVDGYGAKLRDDEEILTLALKALDTERDAALGRAVRGALGGVDAASAQECADWYRDREQIEHVLWSAIAAHLREEQKGGV